MVTDNPVVDASPFIFLAKADLLDLLLLVGKPVLIPEQVATEIRNHEADRAIKSLEIINWIKIISVPETPPGIASWDLGAGESSVLTWSYYHPQSVAIIDDGAARKCAHVWKIKTRGTLGLVILAKQKGLFPFARPIIDRLLQAGLYLNPKIMNEALDFVGE